MHTQTYSLVHTHLYNGFLQRFCSNSHSWKPRRRHRRRHPRRAIFATLSRTPKSANEGEKRERVREAQKSVRSRRGPLRLANSAPSRERVQRRGSSKIRWGTIIVVVLTSPPRLVLRGRVREWSGWYIVPPARKLEQRWFIAWMDFSDFFGAEKSRCKL